MSECFKNPFLLYCIIVLVLLFPLFFMRAVTTSKPIVKRASNHTEAGTSRARGIEVLNSEILPNRSGEIVRLTFFLRGMFKQIAFT